MKFYPVLLGLSLAALSVQAKAAIDQPEYRYICEVENSDMLTLVTVDAFGKYVIYEDPGNNCNGHGGRFAQSDYFIFETDCEWKDGFVNFILETEMVDGENRGGMIAQVTGAVRPAHRYSCKRIQ